MTRRVFIVSFSIALAALAGWFVWRATADASAESSPHVASVGGDRVDEKKPATLPTPSAELAVPAREEAEDRSRETSDDVGAASSGTITLSVIDEDSGAPAADARVHWLDLDEAHVDLDDPTALESATESRGRTMRADSEGKVEVPHAKSRALVTADKGSRWGKLEYGRKTKQLVLTIGDDAPLAAQVLDSKGAPIGGARVVLTAQDWPVRTIAKCDASSGIARLPHALAQMRQNPDLAYFVTVDALLAEPKVVALDLRAIPTSPIVLRLPPIGSAEVRVAPLEGRNSKFATDVELRYVGPRESNDSNNAWSKVKTVDGVASFPIVEVGLRLEAHVRLPELVIGDVAESSDGPREPGDHVLIRLGGGPPRTIVGRAVDEHGRAIASTRIESSNELTHDDEQVESSHTFLDTDAKGIFRIALSPSWNAEQRVSMQLATAQKSRPTQLHGSLELSGEYKTGDNEIGDVVLREARLLVAGRVLDERGQPIAGAGIRAQAQMPNPDEPGRTMWSQLPFAGTSDSSGAFELRGEFDGRVLGLTPESERCVAAEMVEVQVGRSNVELRMLRSGGFDGSVRVDPSVNLREVLVRWTLSSTEHVTSRGTTPCGDSGEPGRGKFVVAGLAPGRAKVEIVAWNDNTPLDTIEDVEVRGGEIAHDPRLVDIDLGGRIHVFMIDVVAPGDVPLQSAMLYTRSTGSKLTWSSWYVQNGRARVTDQSDAIDVAIHLSGYLPEHLTGVRGDTRVELRAGMSVTLALSGDAVVPRGSTLSCELVPTEVDKETQLWPPPVSGVFSSDGSARLSVGSPGSYRVMFNLSDSAGAADRRPVPLTRDAIVKIANSGGPQVVDVALSAAELASAQKHP